MSDGVKETIELGWNILYGIIGAVVTAIGLAMKFGARLQSFVTRDELDKRLGGHARIDQIKRVETALRDLDQKQEARHAQLIELILEGRE